MLFVFALAEAGVIDDGLKSSGTTTVSQGENSRTSGTLQRLRSGAGESPAVLEERFTDEPSAEDADDSADDDDAELRCATNFIFRRKVDMDGDEASGATIAAGRTCQGGYV